MRNTPRDEPETEPNRTEETETAAASLPRKQIYLRTVYPLNPGIPHYVDVPGGWD